MKAVIVSALIGVGIAVASAPEPETTCTIFSFPGRDQGSLSLLGAAFDDSLVVPTDSISFMEFQRFRYDGSVPIGRVVRVKSLGGPLPPTIADYLRRGDSTVVVVSWGRDSMCGPTPATSPRASDGLNQYAVVVRRETEWLSGRPVLDVPPSHFTIYPFHMVQRGFDPTKMLTALEFDEFYRSLPVYMARPSGCPARIAPLENWAQSHRKQRSKFPARDAVETWRNWCRHQPKSQ